MRGSYTILLRVPENRSIKIAKIGIKQFSKGYYVYIGSALNGIENRLKRHMKSDKKLHWHIDYLLQHSDIDLIYYKASKTKQECQIAQTFRNKFYEIPDFGSTDCLCNSHLFFGEKRKLVNICRSLSMTSYKLNANH